MTHLYDQLVLCQRMPRRSTIRTNRSSEKYCVEANGSMAWPSPQVKHDTPQERALLRTLVLKAREVDIQVCSAALMLLSQARAMP